MLQKEKPCFAGQGENRAIRTDSQAPMCQKTTSKTIQFHLFAALPVTRKPLGEWDARLWIYSNADWIDRRRRIRNLVVLDHIWCIPTSVTDLAQRWGWRPQRVQAFLRAEFAPFVTHEAATTAKQGRRI
jgi:hypothetical protein